MNIYSFLYITILFGPGDLHSLANATGLTIRCWCHKSIYNALQRDYGREDKIEQTRPSKHESKMQSKEKG